MSDPFSTFLHTLNALQAMSDRSEERERQQEQRDAMDMASKYQAITTREDGSMRPLNEIRWDTPTAKKFVRNPKIQEVLKHGLPSEVDHVEIDKAEPLSDGSGKFALVVKHYDEDGNLIAHGPVTDGTEGIPPRSSHPDAPVHKVDHNIVHEFIRGELGKINPQLAEHFQQGAMESAFRSDVVKYVQLKPEERPAFLEQVAKTYDLNKFINTARAITGHQTVSPNGLTTYTDQLGSSSFVPTAEGQQRILRGTTITNAQNQGDAAEATLPQGLRIDKQRMQAQAATQNELNNEYADDSDARNLKTGRRMYDQKVLFEQERARKIAEADAIMELANQPNSEINSGLIQKATEIYRTYGIDSEQAKRVSSDSYLTGVRENRVQNSASDYVNLNTAATDPNVDVNAPKVFSTLPKGDSGRMFLIEQLDEAVQNGNKKAAKGLLEIKRLMGLSATINGTAEKAKEPKIAGADIQSLSNLYRSNGLEDRAGAEEQAQAANIQKMHKALFGDYIPEESPEYGTLQKIIGDTFVAAKKFPGDIKYDHARPVFLASKLDPILAEHPTTFITEFYEPLMKSIKSANGNPDSVEDVWAAMNTVYGMQKFGNASFDEALSKYTAFLKLPPIEQTKLVEQAQNWVGDKKMPKIVFGVFLAHLPGETLNVKPEGLPKFLDDARRGATKVIHDTNKGLGDGYGYAP